MLPVVILFLGISWDAGNLLALTREANTIAGASARAAAQQVDQASIYEHQGTGSDGRVALNQGPAELRAKELAGLQEAGDIKVDFFSSNGEGNDIVVVTLTRSYEPTFLGLFGYGTVKVAGEASVRVRSAITTDNYDNSVYLNQSNS